MTGNDVGDYARDAAYTAIGFCVLAAQQLQVHRRELATDVHARVGVSGLGDLSAVAGLRGPNAVVARSGVERLVRQAEAALNPVLDTVERRLPGTARTAMHQSRNAAKILRRAFPL